MSIADGRKITTVFLAFLLAAAAIFALVPASGIIGGPMPQIPQNNTLNAAAIKTQKAADKIDNGVRGIDVSKWNGTINWKKVAGDNVKFAICRATYGAEADATFLTNARGAHENGLFVGAYHYARFTTQAAMEKEAAAFIKQLKKVSITYPVVIDIEQNPKKLTKAKLTNLVNDFADLVKAQGYTVMIYSYQNFFTGSLDLSSMRHDLWVANYLEQPTGIDHKLWQHTSQGKVSGIKGNVDINIAYGDLGTKKKTIVDKTISNSIKETLNSRYKADLPIEGLEMSRINAAIATGLQNEINKQWGASLPVTGTMDNQTLSYLEEINFTSATKGNITYLIQAKLFYKGFYKGELTSVFDQKTVDALAAFQNANGLKGSGEMTDVTLHTLLG